jgi:hypothetical protein
VLGILNEEIIDLERLRAEMGRGIPDEAVATRELVWKLVLGWLPRVRKDWQKQ